jgi:hypothetical protein
MMYAWGYLQILKESVRVCRRLVGLATRQPQTSRQALLFWPAMAKNAMKSIRLIGVSWRVRAFSVPGSTLAVGARQRLESLYNLLNAIFSLSELFEFSNNLSQFRIRLIEGEAINFLFHSSSRPVV